MKRALGIALAVVAFIGLGGCSNTRNQGETAASVPPPPDLPLCSEQFQQGKTIEEDSFGRACATETEEMSVPRYVRLDCVDDRTLVWNEFAWGYVGAAMTLFDPSSNVRMPTQEAMACRANAGNDLQNLVQQRIEELEAITEAREDAERIAGRRVLVGASRLDR